MSAPAPDDTRPVSARTDGVVGRTRDAGAGGQVGFAGIVGAEWLKFRSLRSSVLVLLIAMGAMMLFAAIIAHNTEDPVGQPLEDIVVSGPLQGYYLGQLLLSALGVLVVTGEYSSGTIRTTLAAVPRRVPVLVAKTLVLTVVVGVTMIAASVAAFLIAHAVLSGHRTTTSLTEATTLRVVVGTGIYLTLVCLIGSGIGWIVRTTPGALVATLGLILILPVLLRLVFPSWGDRAAAILPTGAGSSFSTVIPLPHSLSPWPGLAVMAAWAIGLQVVGAVVLMRRDA